MLDDRDSIALDHDERERFEPAQGVSRMQLRQSALDCRVDTWLAKQPRDQRAAAERWKRRSGGAPDCAVEEDYRKPAVVHADPRAAALRIAGPQGAPCTARMDAGSECAWTRPPLVTITRKTESAACRDDRDGAHVSWPPVSTARSQIAPG